MSAPKPPSSPRSPLTELLQKVPATTWAGIVGVLLLAIIGIASGGIFSAFLLVATAVLITGIYGFAFRRTTWLRLPRKRSAAAIGAGIALAVLIGTSSAYGAGHASATDAAPQAGSAGVTSSASPSTVARAASPTPTPTHVVVVTSKDISQASPVPFASKSIADPARAKGTSAVTTRGVAGVDTKTFTITYSDGVETSRVLKSDVVTTQPVAQVTSVGTYVAPPPPPAAPTNCTNGTYVNSAGTTVCSPEVSPGAPAGATAKCGDGTYSFSQSRRGTCSHHGGVSEWL